MLGLNHHASQEDYAHYADLDFAIYLQADGTLSVYESGRRIFASLHPYEANDTVTIRVNPVISSWPAF